MSPTIVKAPDAPDGTDPAPDAPAKPKRTKAEKAERRERKARKASAAVATEDTEATEKSDDSPFYCPGCGRRFEYRRPCTGTATAPHPEIEVVSTDELSGPEDKHTPAPASLGG